MQTRRQFAAAIAGTAASLLASRPMFSMQTTQSFAGPMQQDAYLPVKLAPKPGAGPSMTDEARDELEHQIKCQCGCVLDVFTCRTTDFSCGVSPAMHRDVMALVAGGHDGAAIMGAFQSVYGERVLMAPLKKGFNWLGYIMPFAAIIGGGGIVAILIRRWGARAKAEARFATPAGIDASPEELERLDARLREDG
jgi:cytochrome c-type biogenesis protein CcmH